MRASRRIAGDLFCLSGRFNRLDFLVREAEMMSYLMYENMADQIAEGCFAIVDPLSKNRLSVQVDMIGSRWNVIERSACQIDAFIKAGQLERIVDIHVVKNVVVGEVGDVDHQIAALSADGRRQRSERLAGKRVEFIKAWRAPVRPRVLHRIAA